MADSHERFVLIAMEEARQGGAEGNVAVPGIPARGDMTVLSTGMSAPGRPLPSAARALPTIGFDDAVVKLRRPAQGPVPGATQGARTRSGTPGGLGKPRGCYDCRGRTASGDAGDDA